MNILLVGSGGREHALAWKIAASPLVKRLKAPPGNPGMAAVATLHDVDPMSGHDIAGLAVGLGIDLVVVGPEAPLVAGVADAVRSLASRTQSSTEEVDKMVQRFQSNSLKAFEQMRMAEETVRTNVATAQESGSSIKTVLRTVSELNNLNTEISHSVDQQSQVAEDINKNITRINNTGDQSQERAAETLRASEGLSKLSEDIQRQLAAYRV